MIEWRKPKYAEKEMPSCHMYFVHVLHCVVSGISYMVQILWNLQIRKLTFGLSLKNWLTGSQPVKLGYMKT